MIVLWAARLGSFLFRQVTRDGGDGRFDKIKLDALRFSMAWMLRPSGSRSPPARPAAMTSGAKADLGGRDHRSRRVAIGFAIEVTADRQKSAFRADPANRGRFIDVGLWAWSRHPNYFGEITLWLGVAIVAAPVLQGWQYATLVSPVFVFVLLNFVSGVPMLERRSDREWGQEAYEAFKAKTPVLILRPRADPTASCEIDDRRKSARARPRLASRCSCSSNQTVWIESSPGRRPMPDRRRPH